MTATALALVLTAAFFHATWNYLSKRSMGGACFIWLVAVTASILYLPVAIYAYTTSVSFGLPELGLCLVSASIHLIYFFLLQTGYQRGELSLVYPLARATGPLLSTVAAILLLGEEPTSLALLGGAIIILGIFFLTRNTGGQALLRNRPSLIFGVSTGLVIGCYTVWDGYLVSVALISPLLLDYFTTLGRSLLMLPYIVSNQQAVMEEWRNSRAEILGVALLSPAAYIMVLYAMTSTPIHYIAPAREVSVIFGVLLGSILLKEGHLVRRLSWSVIVVLGMFVLASN